MSNEYKIELTKPAIDHFKKEIINRNTPNACIRLGVKGGSCEGLKYFIDFCDDESRNKDIEFIFDGLKVLIDNKSIVYLNGSTLDYKKTLFSQEFVWNNPNSVSECGCGKSFNVLF